MTTTHQSLTRTLLTGVVGVALIGGLVAGCQLFDSQSSPTVPQQSVSTEQVGQCFATSEAPTEWAYSYTPGEAVFCVSVPEAGAYLLRYVVNGGTHEVVFEISAAKRVYIGLLSNADELTAVSLQRGTLRDGATPLEGDRGDIRFYALPGSGVASGSVLSGLSKAFALSNNGAPCLVIIPQPTPVTTTATSTGCPAGTTLYIDTTNLYCIQGGCSGTPISCPTISGYTLITPYSTCSGITGYGTVLGCIYLI